MAWGRSRRAPALVQLAASNLRWGTVRRSPAEPQRARRPAAGLFSAVSGVRVLVPDPGVLDLLAGKLRALALPEDLRLPDLPSRRLPEVVAALSEMTAGE